VPKNRPVADQRNAGVKPRHAPERPPTTPIELASHDASSTSKEDLPQQRDALGRVSTDPSQHSTVMLPPGWDEDFVA